MRRGRGTRGAALAALVLVVVVGPTGAGGDEPRTKTRTPTFAQVVHHHFAGWDHDHDGALSVAEIDAAVEDPRTTGPAAAAAAALKRATSNKAYKLPKLTRAELDQLIEKPTGPDRPNLPRLYADAGARIARVTERGLFSGGLPRLETIHQGRLGNCFCLAPIGAMVAHDPARVARLFHLRPDGSYDVTLGHRTVHVTPPTEAELAITSSNERSGVWVNLYEKAVGEVLRKPGAEAQLAIDVIARGGSAGSMLRVLTGHEIVRFKCSTAADPKLSPADRQVKLDELRHLLISTSGRGHLMTCGTTKPTTPGITPNHAYAVLGFDEKSDMIRLWNPHGGNFNPKGDPGRDHGWALVDGRFNLPLTDFVHVFAGVAFETDRPTKP